MNVDSVGDLGEWMNSMTFILFSTFSSFSLHFDRKWIAIDLNFNCLASALTAEIFVLLIEARCVSFSSCELFYLGLGLACSDRKFIL